MEGDSLLDINLEFCKGILFIRLKGELNKSTVNKLKEEGIESIYKDNVANISGLEVIDDKTIRNKVNGFIKETLENKNSLEYETNIEDAMKNIKNNNKEIYSFLKKYNESADEISTLFKEKISYVLGKEIEKYINFNKIDNENKNKFKSASQ